MTSDRTIKRAWTAKKSKSTLDRWTRPIFNQDSVDAQHLFYQEETETCLGQTGGETCKKRNWDRLIDWHESYKWSGCFEKHDCQSAFGVSLAGNKRVLLQILSDSFFILDKFSGHSFLKSTLSLTTQTGSLTSQVS